MKKLILFITIIIGILSANFANAQWIKTNTSYSGASIVVSGNNIYASYNNSIVYLSIDSGSTWTVVNGWKSINSLVENGMNIFAVINGGVFLSSDSCHTWTALNSLTTGVTSLVISGNNIFAGTHRGVYLSTDTGNTWTVVNNGLTDSIIDYLAVSGNNIVAATRDSVFLSTNNGSNWSVINTPKNIDIWSLAASGSNIFVGASSGIFLSPNNGSNWSLSAMYVDALVIKGNYILAGAWDGIYLSTDNGSSWSAVNKGLNDLTITSIAIDNTNIFIGTGVGIWKRPLSDINCNIAKLAVTASGAITFCKGDSVTLTSSSVLGIVWNTGEKTKSIKVSNQGKYSVTIQYAPNCSDSAATTVIVNTLPTAAITQNGTVLTSLVAKQYQWNLNGMPISAANTQLYIVTVAGSYTVTVTDSNGCSTTSSPVVITGIEEQTQNNIFTIYPNPTKDNLTLTLSNKEKTTITIYDILGNQLSDVTQNKKEDTYQIDLSAQQAGIYFIKVQNEKANEVKKVVLIK